MASAYTAPSITASGVTFSVAKNLSGHLDALIAAQVGTADPTVAPTLSVTGTGGTLPTATYTVKITETNGVGETLPKAAAATQAVTLGDNLVVTFATLKSGNTARNVYIAAASDALVLVGRGITASTLTISAPLPTDSSAVALPTANTTAPSTKQLELLRAAKLGNLQQAFDHAASVYRAFLSGEPMAHDRVLKHLRESHLAVAALNTAFNELGALVVANPGSLSSTAWGAGLQKTQRTF